MTTSGNATGPGSVTHATRVGLDLVAWECSSARACERAGLLSGVQLEDRKYVGELETLWYYDAVF